MSNIWNNINDSLPEKMQKVKYKMKNRVEDIGFFNGKDFVTIDPKSEDEIIEWKPLNINHE